MKNFKNFVLYFVVVGFASFCIVFGGCLLINYIIDPNSEDVHAAEASEISEEIEESEEEQEEDAVEYDIVNTVDDVLPEGLYLYSVEGSYLTLGIEDIGVVSGTDQRAVVLTFFGTSEQGDVIDTYKDMAIQSSSDDHLFQGTGKKYNVIFQDTGIITVECLVDYNNLGTTLGFEGNYIYLYSFEESTVEEGDMDYE